MPNLSDLDPNCCLSYQGYCTKKEASILSTILICGSKISVKEFFNIVSNKRSLKDIYKGIKECFCRFEENKFSYNISFDSCNPSKIILLYRKFKDCIFSNISICSSFFNNCDFVNCIFNNVSIDDSCFDYSLFENCTFNDCIFKNSYMYYTDLNKCNLNNCYLENLNGYYLSDISECNIENTKIIGCDFLRSDISNSILKYCKIINMFVSASRIYQTSLDSCFLFGIRYSSLSLINVKCLYVKNTDVSAIFPLPYLIPNCEICIDYNHYGYNKLEYRCILNCKKTYLDESKIEERLLKYKTEKMILNFESGKDLKNILEKTMKDNLNKYYFDYINFTEYVPF